MTLSDFFERTYGITEPPVTVRKIACADDGQSFFYIALPFPGVFCWANDVFCREIPAGIAEAFYGLSLNFCTEGACEVELFNGNFVYVKKGILSLDTSAAKKPHNYPTSRYRGLEVIFDFSVLSQNGGGELAAFGFSPLDFAHHLAPRSENGSFMAAPGDEWSKNAQALTERLIAQDITIEEIRFYLLGLLFPLGSGAEQLRKAQVCHLTKGQRMIAAEAACAVAADMRHHVTVEELAAAYAVSASSLKKYFMELYGIPFSRYAKKLRMEAAARLIAEGTLSMGEVAAAVGYQNQGKFSAAFKEFFGSAPLEYKRLCAGGAADVPRETFKMPDGAKTTGRE